jgi:3-dehydroquinate synthase
MDKQVTNIVLTGFSGTGKSLVAKEVAQRLNWNFIDTDDEIVKLACKPIAEIFQQDGEKKFRKLEYEIIEKACQQRQTIIAVGGGAIVGSRNYKLLAENGFIVCLEAKPETIYQRLFHEAAEPEIRPLLSTKNPLERIRQLKAQRQPYYANADWTVHTDNLSISEVAEEVVKARKLLHFAYNEADKDIACRVETATQSYLVFVGWGLLDKLGDKIKQADLSGIVNIISDATVFSIYGQRVESVLQNAGFIVNSFVVPPGETSKNIDSATKIYDFLVEHRVERDDILIALGGGMVGDLAGFVAATFLRGMPWIQVPTSLIGMVDASIGGKVAVNHPQGKNLIGAFYQPSFVLADVQALISLPQRELSSGWAEVIKHGLILDREYFEFLEANVDKLVKLEPNIIAQAIARSAAIKAQVVATDEKEKGKRTILNYGHTIAHGLESATQYRHLLHGEAVAIGMMGAAKLSQRLNLLSTGVVERQQALLERFNLPVSLRPAVFAREAKQSHQLPKLSLAEVTRAMELDKKMRGKAIRWVLLSDIGEAIIRSDVPQQEVETVLQELSQP